MAAPAKNALHLRCNNTVQANILVPVYLLQGSQPKQCEGCRAYTFNQPHLVLQFKRKAEAQHHSIQLHFACWSDSGSPNKYIWKREHCDTNQQQAEILLSTGAFEPKTALP